MSDYFSTGHYLSGRNCPRTSSPRERLIQQLDIIYRAETALVRAHFVSDDVYSMKQFNALAGQSFQQRHPTLLRYPAYPSSQ